MALSFKRRWTICLRKSRSGIRSIMSRVQTIKSSVSNLLVKSLKGLYLATRMISKRSKPLSSSKNSTVSLLKKNSQVVLVALRGPIRSKRSQNSIACSLWTRLRMYKNLLRRSVLTNWAIRICAIPRLGWTRVGKRLKWQRYRTWLESQRLSLSKHYQRSVVAWILTRALPCHPFYH